MAEKRNSTICCRMPDSIKIEMEKLANQFDLSLSDIVVKLCRKGLQDISPSFQYQTQKKNQPLLH